MPITRPLTDRFHEKYMPEPNTGCWLWMNFTNPKGYGLIHVKQGQMRLAHRISYEIHVGKIPDGLCVCHVCDTPCCVNPTHLFLGTNLDNHNDKIRKKRNAYGSMLKQSDLTDSDCINIINRFKDGENYSVLVKEFSINQSTLYALVYGKIRRYLGVHLNEPREHFKRLNQRKSNDRK